MKKGLTIGCLAVLLFPFLLSGQPGKGKLKVSEYIAQANELMLQASYDEAAKNLEKVVSLEPQNTTLLYQLAEAYRLSRNSAQAARNYGRVLKFSDGPAYLNYPLILFYYGNAVMQNGNYEEAKILLMQFINSYKADKESHYKTWAKILIEGCEMEESGEFTNSDKAFLHLDRSINGGKTNYAPLLLREDLLLFSSLRPDRLHNDNERKMRSTIYTSQHNGEKWMKPVPFSGPFRYLEDHTGHGTFSPDKERFYFTICPTKVVNKPECSIYYSQLDGTMWTDPVGISTINIAGFQSSTPFASWDALGTERIYFSSNRPGGEGGLDIWYVIRDDKGNFTSAINLGSKVNTAYNEITPYVNGLDKRLYFSSEGWPGFGGYDIFHIYYDGTDFGTIRNIGKPFNSSQDDMYYTENPDNQGGFMVSNRFTSSGANASTCCDDIFAFRSKEDHSGYPEVLIRGRAFGIEGEQTFELDDVTVQWLEITKTGHKLWLGEENAFKGQPFEFKASWGKSYEMVLEKQGYATDVFNFGESQFILTDSLFEKDFFLYSEGTLVRGVVYGDDGQHRVLLPGVEMKVYQVMPITGKLRLIKTLNFDEEGFRTALSGQMDYKIVFTRPDYFVGSLAISRKELKESGIPEFHIALKRKQAGLSFVIPGIEFQNSSADLDASSRYELDKLAEFLEDNPKLIVEIGAFTDNAGSAAANKAISVNRAMAIVSYLVGKGIVADRLSSKGHGEANPLADNKTEENRELNRRVELKILKIEK